MLGFGLAEKDDFSRRDTHSATLQRNDTGEAQNLCHLVIFDFYGGAFVHSENIPSQQIYCSRLSDSNGKL